MRYELDPAAETIIRDVPEEVLEGLKETTVYDSSELLARAGMKIGDVEPVERESPEGAAEIDVEWTEEESPRAPQCMPPTPRRSRGSLVLLFTAELLFVAGMVYLCRRWLGVAF